MCVLMKLLQSWRREHSGKKWRVGEMVLLMLICFVRLKECHMFNSAGKRMVYYWTSATHGANTLIYTHKHAHREHHNHYCFIRLDIFPMEASYFYIGYVSSLLKFNATKVYWIIRGITLLSTHFRQGYMQNLGALMKEELMILNCPVTWAVLAYLVPWVKRPAKCKIHLKNNLIRHQT